MTSTKEIVSARSAIIQEIRSFFLQRNFLEVDTPVLHLAPVPEAFIELFATGPYLLQASPEYLMKRLVAREIGPIFQLARCFRKNETGRHHLQEFLLLEWYRPGSYLDLMADCRALLLHLQQTTTRTLRMCAPTAAATPLFLRRDFRCDKDPWPSCTVADAFRRHSDITPEEALRQCLFEEILSRDIEPHLGADCPFFLMDYPAACGSLAKTKSDDPTVTERFELYIRGIEIANGFSELNDPTEQRVRFKKEHEQIRRQGRVPPPMPEGFLRDLAAMPPTAGIALGIDRLVMLLTGRKEIAEVVFSPQELFSV